MVPPSLTSQGLVEIEWESQDSLVRFIAELGFQLNSPSLTTIFNLSTILYFPLRETLALAIDSAFDT